jgi:hypothetical protein
LKSLFYNSKHFAFDFPVEGASDDVDRRSDNFRRLATAGSESERHFAPGSFKLRMDCDYRGRKELPTLT